MMSSAKFFVCLILFEKLLASTQENSLHFRIVGGSRPRDHTFVKYVVSIQSRGNHKFGSTHNCVGVILYQRYILTAAHCLWNSRLNQTLDPKQLQIVAGTPNRLKKTEHTQVIDIQQVTVHPYYDKKTHANDIGGLHLKDDINLDGTYAQNIPLIDGPPKENQSCTVVGWGRLFDLGPLAAEALYADVNIVPGKLCEDYFVYFKSEHGQICVIDQSDTEKGLCQGDSGGPLICDGKVAGLVSYADGCGGIAVFMDVWFYRDNFLKKWICGCQARTSIKIMYILLLKLLVWIFI